MLLGSSLKHSHPTRRTTPHWMPLRGRRRTCPSCSTGARVPLNGWGFSLVRHVCPRAQSAKSGKRWEKVFPSAMMGFWYCSDPFFCCSKAKCKCVPTFPRPEEADKEKKKGGAALGLGSKKWCLCGNFMNIYPTFCSFWHFLDFRRKPNFLKRRFWMDHPGWILSTH